MGEEQVVGRTGSSSCSPLKPDVLTRVPREIWEMILLKLPYYEDLVMASLSCQLWRTILADHLVCPAASYVVAHGWKVERPFLYNFLPGTPPSDKEEFPLDRAVNNWVTWPHVPLCFEVILRNRNQRKPRFKSRAHYGLDIRWRFKGFIPYTDKDRRMELDTRSQSSSLALATNEDRSGTTIMTAALNRLDHEKGTMMDTESTAPDGEREPKRARALDGRTEESRMELERRHGNGDTRRVEPSVEDTQMMDVERHIVRADTADENNTGQFTFYSRPVFLMRCDQLKETVSSLIDEARRERRSDVPMFGLIVERSKPGSVRLKHSESSEAAPSMMRDSEWRHVKGRAIEGSGSGGALASPRKVTHAGKSYMAGFYIPHMDKYAYGTDTLVFELEIKVGGSHIPSSPFLLSFFNPLLP